jgi:hypothetical protein
MDLVSGGRLSPTTGRSGHIHRLSDNQDVDVRGATPGDLLVWTGQAWVAQPSSLATSRFPTFTKMGSVWDTTIIANVAMDNIFIDRVGVLWASVSWNTAPGKIVAWNYNDRGATVPFRDIEGSNTGLGTAPGNKYGCAAADPDVGIFRANTHGNKGVSVFHTNANGNDYPWALISQADTGWTGAYGPAQIFLGPGGDLWVRGPSTNTGVLYPAPNPHSYTIWTTEFRVFHPGQTTAYKVFSVEGWYDMEPFYVDPRGFLYTTDGQVIRVFAAGVSDTKPVQTIGDPRLRYGMSDTDWRMSAGWSVTADSFGRIYTTYTGAKYDVQVYAADASGPNAVPLTSFGFASGELNDAGVMIGGSFQIVKSPLGDIFAVLDDNLQTVNWYMLNP